MAKKSPIVHFKKTGFVFLFFVLGCLCLAWQVSLSNLSISLPSSFRSDLWPPEKQAEINFWERITAQYPDYPDAYLSLAQLYLEKGETEKAVHYYQLASQLAPNHPDLEKINLKNNP